MKRLKERLAVAGVFVIAALLCSIIAVNNRNNHTHGGIDGYADVWDDTPPDTAASDAPPPQTQTPVLKIGGQVNPDVYLQSLDI